MAESSPQTSPTLLKINNISLASVQRYQRKTIFQNHFVRAYGTAQPVAHIPICNSYLLEFSQLLWTQEGQAVSHSLEQLKNFTLTLVYPHKIEEYSGCQWKSITETLTNGKPLWTEFQIEATAFLQKRGV